MTEQGPELGERDLEARRAIEAVVLARDFVGAVEVEGTEARRPGGDGARDEHREQDGLRRRLSPARIGRDGRYRRRRRAADADQGERKEQQGQATGGHRRQRTQVGRNVPRR